MDQYNLETAVQGGKVMPDFELESLSMVAAHSQKVKASSSGSDYGSKDCVNLPASTAVSRFNVIAYYIFTPISNPKEEVEEQRRFLENMGATGRIYISEEGINGQLSCTQETTATYIDWMHARPPFKGVEFKQQSWHEHAFPRLTVKYRKYLVGRDREFDFSKTGKHLSPDEWKKMLESEDKPLLLDIRNEYEWKVGRFEGAEAPPCETFRDFEAYAEKLKETFNPKEKQVMMYCTGGIRCEIYSSLLKELGFENVYQLQGGIIKYGQKMGTKHWQGKLFVFDDRLTVSISDEPSPVVGSCHHCKTPIESYYNCANMDCNALYLCCPVCLQEHIGCCQLSCKNAPRVRPYQEQHPHKPFRRAHLL